MSKTIKALVQNNTGEVTETLDVVQGAGDKGNPARLKAVRGARYQLEDPAANNTGPDSVRTKRVGKHLNVMLEGSTEPDLIVENYYDDAVMVDASGGLYGRAEDGNLYEYIPEDPIVANLPVALADGGVPVSQVLGGGAVASTFQLAALPLLAVGGGALSGGGLLAAAGVLGAASLAGGGGGTTPTGSLANAPDLLASADTGVSNTDNITANTKPGFNVGVVPAGSTAQLVVDGAVVPSQATLDADGNTILTPAAALTEGPHALAFNYKDAQNVVSGNSPAMTVTIDSQSPAAPAVATAPEMADGVINGSDAVDGTVIAVPLTGTNAVEGDTVTVTVDGVDTSYVLKAADIAAQTINVAVPNAVLVAAGQGAAAVTSFVTDVAGNKSPLSAALSLNIDTKAPTAPGVAVIPENSAGGVNAAEAADGVLVSISIAATGAVAGDVLTVMVDGVPTPYTLTAQDLIDGVARVLVPKSVIDAAGQGSATVISTLTDASNNVSANSPTALIRIDTLAPNKPGAPVVPENADGGINIAESADGTPVEVSLVGTNALAGDKLTVIIDGVSTVYTLLATDITAGKAIVTVPAAVLAAAGPGPASVTATLTDPAGNVSVPSDATPINIQSALPSAPAAPVVPEAAGGLNAAEVVDGTPVEVSLTGTGATPGDTVTVTVDGVPTVHTVTQAEVDAGKAVVTVPPAVLAAAGQGPASVTATVTVAGNTSPASPATTITIDTVAPTEPVAPVVLEAANGGINAVEAVDGTPVEVSLAGTGAVAGDVVKVIVDGVSTPHTLTQAEVDAGKAIVTVPAAVLASAGQGPAEVTATITDAAGNTSPPSPATTITIDTVAPVAPVAPVVAENAGGGINVVEAADGTVVEVSLAGTNAVAGDKVTVTIDGTPTDYILLPADITAGKAMVPVSAAVLAAAGQGPATVTATITDVAGNTSAPSPATTITIDTVVPVAPAAPVVAENANGGINAVEAVDGTPVEVSLAGTGAVAGDVVKVIVDGVSTPHTLTQAEVDAGKAIVTVPAAVLASAGQGPAEVTATITDAAGNTSPPSPATTITIDTVAPVAPVAPVVAENAGGGINVVEAADGTVVEVSLAGTNAVAGDKVTVTIDGTPTDYILLPADITAGKAMVPVSAAVLAAAGQGPATVTATITDVAGNTSSPSPATAINIDTQGGGVNTAVTFTGLTVDVPTLTVGDSKDTGSSATDFITSDRTLTIQGTASGFSNFGAAANDKVWVQILAPDGVTVVAEGAVVPDASGVFTFSNQAISLPDGKYTIKTSIVDGLGNLVKAGDNQALVIDGSGVSNPGNTPSTVDTNTGVSFNSLSIHDVAMGSTDSGSSNTDFITNDNTLVIEGNVTGFTSTGGTAGDQVRVQIFAADGTTVVAEKFVTPDGSNHYVFDNKAMTLADGKYTLKTSIVDAAGNLVKAGDAQALVIDTNDSGTNPASNPGNPNPVDPNAASIVSFSGLTINGLGSDDTGSSSTDFVTSDTTLLITGTVSNYSAAGGGIGDKVLVQIMAADGVTVVAQGFVTPDVFTGQYTFDNKANALADGKYTIKTSIVDAAGNTVKPGDSQLLVIDTNNGGTTPGSNPGNENGQPNSAVDSNTGVTFSAFSITDAAKQSADTGASATDFITNDATLVFKGTAAGFTIAGGAAGDRVRVQVLAADGVTVVAQQYVTPAGNGDFVFDNTGNTLFDGNYTVKVAVVDAAGNVVKAGTAQPLVIDTSATINPANANGVDTNTGVSFDQLSINNPFSGSNDDGTSTTDFITTDGTLAITGHVNNFSATGATAGDRVLVQILNNVGVVVAEKFVIPDGNGNYAFDNTASGLADGNYKIMTSVVDAAGNTVKTGDMQPLVINASASNAVNITGITTDTGASSSDLVTSDTTLVVSGNVTAYIAASGNQVHVTVLASDGVTLVVDQFVTPNAQGIWSLDNTANALMSGQYTVHAELVNAAHVSLGVSNTRTLVVETAGTPDAALTFSGLTIHDVANGSTDTGASSTDFITSDNTLMIEGKVTNFTPAHAAAGDKVLVQILAADGTTVVAQQYVTPDALGNYVFDNKANNLADGDYTIKTSIVSLAGNLIKVGESHALVIDTAAPAAPLTAPLSYVDNVGPITNPASTAPTTDDTMPGLNIGAVPVGTQPLLYVDGTAVPATYDPVTGVLTPTTPLTEGPHALTYALTDPAGLISNPSPALNLTIDTMAPTKPNVVTATDDAGQVTGPIAEGSTTDDTKPTFSGTGTAGDTVDVYNGPTLLGTATVAPNGSWSLTPTTALPNGAYTITTVEKDPAGNPSLPSDPLHFTVNNTAPMVSITSVSDNFGSITGNLTSGDVTDDATPTFTGTATANAVVTIKDGTTVLGTAQADGTGNWTYTPASAQAEGPHAYTASVTVAGNTATSTNFALTVDTAAPVLGTLSITDTGSSPTDGITKNGTVTVGALEAGATWQYSTDSGVTWNAGTGTSFTLAQGTYSAGAVQMRETDAAGNVQTGALIAKNAAAITVDTTAPVIGTLSIVDTGSSPTDGITNNGTVTVGALEAGTTWEYSTDSGATWNAGSGTSFALAQGAYAAGVVQMRETDVAGNVQTGALIAKNTAAITIDTMAPTKPNVVTATDDAGQVTGPIAEGSTTDDTKPTFSGTGTAGDTVDVYNGPTLLGTATVAPNGSWSLTPTTALPNGAYTITTVEKDPAGNPSLPSDPLHFTVNNTAPMVSITTVSDNVGSITANLTSGDVTDDATPTFTGTATANAVVTIKDGVTVLGTAQADGTGNWTYTPAAQLGGLHNYNASVTVAGNTATTTDFVLNVDLIAPVISATGNLSYVDNVGPITSTNSTAATTDDTTPGLNVGTVPADTSPKLYVDGVAVAATYDPVTGAITPITPLTQGPHALTYTLVDTAGWESNQSPALNLTIVGNPVFTSGATASAAENLAITATVYDAQADGDTGITYTLTGADASKFSIDASTGAVKFLASPDFEAPTDAGANNVYDITVRATNAAGAFSDKAVAVTVTNVNDAPVLSFGSSVNYNENSAATAINTLITVADQDNTTLTSATVSISGGYVANQDVLSFTNVAGTMGNIAASVVGGVMTLTSAGSTATLAEWQAALRAVSYSNTSDIPNTAARTISYVINDGALNATAITSILSVFAVNDAPVLAYSYVDSHALTTSTVPTVTVTDSSLTATTNNTNATFTLTFSEAIDASSLTAADITVSNGTLVSMTQVDATHWTVVAKAPMSGTGVMAVSLADGAYKSLAGVDGLGGSDTQAYGVGSPSTVITGTSAVDTLIGSDEADTITLNGGADQVFAGAGDDQIIINASSLSSMAVAGNGMKIDGGAGINTLTLDIPSGQNLLDLTDATTAAKLSHISTIDLGRSDTASLVSNFLHLSVDNILALASDSKIFVVNGGQGDGVYLVNASLWTHAPEVVSGMDLDALYGSSYGFDIDGAYYEYTLNGATLYMHYYMGEPSEPDLSLVNAYNGGVTQAVTIDSLFAGGFTDVETALATPQTFQGVAVTFAGTAMDALTLGKYQYLNASNAWIDLPTGLTDTNAVYLDHGTKIRFLAATGNSAMAKPDMQVRLIDSTLPATVNGATIDAHVNGGITPFSGQAMTLTDHVVAHISDNAASVAANGGTVTYTLTFSGAVDPATVTSADIEIMHMSNLGAVSGGAVSNFVYDPVLQHWTFNVNAPSSGSGTTLISLQDGTYTSATGVLGAGATVAQTYGTAGATDLTAHSLTLDATASGVVVDATQVATFEAMQGVSTVDISGGGINALKIDLHAVMEMPTMADNATTTAINESHTVVVNGNGTGAPDASDVLGLVDSASWTTSATHLTAANLTSAYGSNFAFTSGHQYAQYTNGMATLFVDEQVFVSPM
ncbi:S-layer family protein [Limnohabitans sp. TS-CS-82]|uniref:beta strand repeat-containing protein n=1 Tax=Limnohabitans sp. TS-CS-82 TaxID=2094193 RepID=UPI001374DF36|nr:Ig-like domain-containing protein [Limnohabitans sp. TS-CS-82]